MIKRDIAYTDWDGAQKVERAYFNLTQAELMDLEQNFHLQNMIQRAVVELDGAVLTSLIKLVVLKSYGEKTDTNKFIKSDTISENFSHTEAYSVLYMDLLKDDTKLAAFLEGVMPNELMEQVKAEQNNADNNVLAFSNEADLVGVHNKPEQSEN